MLGLEGVNLIRGEREISHEDEFASRSDSFASRSCIYRNLKLFARVLFLLLSQSLPTIIMSNPIELTHAIV